jgi:hypothetical protein
MSENEKKLRTGSTAVKGCSFPQTANPGLTGVPEASQ